MTQTLAQFALRLGLVPIVVDLSQPFEVPMVYFVSTEASPELVVENTVAAASPEDAIDIGLRSVSQMSWSDGGQFGLYNQVIIIKSSVSAEGAQAISQIKEEQKLVSKVVDKINILGSKFTQISVFTSEHLYQQTQTQNSLLFSLPQMLLNSYQKEKVFKLYHDYMQADNNIYNPVSKSVDI